MGSVGDKTEQNYKQYLQNSNYQNLDEYDEQILNDAQMQEESYEGRFANGWDFPAIKQKVDELEESLNNTNSESRIASIYKSLHDQEVAIDRSLRGNNPNYDRDSLLAYKRRIQQMKKRIEKWYE